MCVWGGGGGYINVKNMYECYMKFDFVLISHNIRDIGHVGKKHMTYWNHLFACCEELV